MKKQARKTTLEKRENITSSRRHLKSWLIKKHLINSPEWNHAKTIMLYIAIKSEVKTTRIIKTALNQGKTVLVPKIKNRKIIPVKLKTLANLENSTYGVPIPSNAQESKEKIDLIIVPGIAFDCKGNRIGYGGGYYDKFLKKQDAQTIALAYEEQLLQEIKSEPHDQKVKKIITEKRIIECE
ncbi:5-formyltetrahydrofolate cyclo-ligase [archaeon]|nr:5-formyltetrahydrofolate cyclo-ligase [archaeon]